MEDQPVNHIWSIGGGKGGVGKSIVTLLLGTMLAKHGNSVLLVDADLGGSNLHTLLGIRYPACTLADFLQKRVINIEDLIIDTAVHNLRLICGADDVPGIANPSNSQRARLVAQLKRIPSDFILLDLGAGISYTTIDLFLSAMHHIVIMTPQHTSIQNSYGFIKASLYRKISQAFKNDAACTEIIEQGIYPDRADRIESIDELRDQFWIIGEDRFHKLNDLLNAFNMDLMVNMVRDKQDTYVGTVIQSVAKNYLNLNIAYPGHINYDHTLELSINEMADYLVSFMSSFAGNCVYEIAQKIMKKSAGVRPASISSDENEDNSEELSGHPVSPQDTTNLIHAT